MQEIQFDVLLLTVIEEHPLPETGSDGPLCVSKIFVLLNIICVPPGEGLHNIESATLTLLLTALFWRYLHL